MAKKTTAAKTGTRKTAKAQSRAGAGQDQDGAGEHNDLACRRTASRIRDEVFQVYPMYILKQKARAARKKKSIKSSAG